MVAHSELVLHLTKPSVSPKINMTERVTAIPESLYCSACREVNTSAVKMIVPIGPIMDCFKPTKRKPLKRVSSKIGAKITVDIQNNAGH